MNLYKILYAKNKSLASKYIQAVITEKQVIDAINNASSLAAESIGRLIRKGIGGIIKKGDIEGYRGHKPDKEMLEAGWLEQTKSTYSTTYYKLTALGYKVGSEVKQLGIENVADARFFKVKIKVGDTKQTLKRRLYESSEQKYGESLNKQAKEEFPNLSKKTKKKTPYLKRVK